MFRRSFQACVSVLSVAMISAAATTAAAQTPQTAETPSCSAPLVLVGDLGLGALKCTGCSFVSRRMPGLAFVDFSTEPTLVNIAKGGPADGKLQAYDVLVALNGRLITTQAGASLFSWPPPDKSVRVTYRRSGSLKDADIVPTARCRPIGASALWSLTGSELVLAAPTLPANRGWFGISIQGPPLNSYQEITNVVADSPAEKAGLRIGDLLVAMDGRSLKGIEATVAFRDVKPGQKVVLSVIRDGDFLKLTVILGTQR